MAFWDKIFAGEKKDKPEKMPADLMSKEKVVTAEKSGQEILHTRASHEKPGKGAGVLTSPHMTEKTTDMVERGVYVFKVERTANKEAIAAAVTGRYGVAVERVRIVTQPSKERTRGRQIGWKQGFKKAIVQLKEGQTIETL